MITSSQKQERKGKGTAGLISALNILFQVISNYIFTHIFILNNKIVSIKFHVALLQTNLYFKPMQQSKVKA